MLHCPRTIARTIVYSGVFLATGLLATGPAFAADPTGDWKVADGLQHTDELLVQVARMQGTSLRLTLYKQPGYV